MIMFYILNKHSNAINFVERSDILRSDFSQRVYSVFINHSK